VSLTRQGHDAAVGRSLIAAILRPPNLSSTYRCIDKSITERYNEIKYLQERFLSPRAELVLVYGRRRVGKTALLRHVGENFDGIFP